MTLRQHRKKPDWWAIASKRQSAKNKASAGVRAVLKSAKATTTLHVRPVTLHAVAGPTLAEIEAKYGPL